MGQQDPVPHARRPRQVERDALMAKGMTDWSYKAYRLGLRP